jgi:hypothetical protein
MKIPEDKYFSDEADRTWERAAAQIGVEYGIMVEVGRDIEHTTSTYHSGPNGQSFNLNDSRITRIFFKLNGHEFETLTDLKRALQLKAFL